MAFLRQEVVWERKTSSLAFALPDLHFAERQRKSSRDTNARSQIERAEGQGVATGSSQGRILVCLEENCRTALEISREALGRGLKGSRFRALQFDGAGDRMNFHASAAVTHVRAQRVFALLFNDDRNVRANLAGYGARGKMKVRTGGHGNVHGARDRLQLPIAVAAWISLGCQTARGGAAFHVCVCSTHLDRSAGGIGIHATTWIAHANVS